MPTSDLFCRDSVCCRGCGEGRAGLGVWQRGSCRGISDDHLCCNHLFLHVVDTDVPASGWRFYKPKFFHVCYLFIHPLCALSAFESRDCSQAAVLRDLKRNLVGLGAKSVFWGHVSSKKDLVSISFKNAACVCLERPPEWSAGCREARRPHLVGQSCPSPLCLRIALRWTL